MFGGPHGFCTLYSIENRRNSFIVALNLIGEACQLTLKVGLVGILNPTAVGLLHPTPQCPIFDIVLFCIETVPKAGHFYLKSNYTAIKVWPHY